LTCLAIVLILYYRNQQDHRLDYPCQGYVNVIYHHRGNDTESNANGELTFFPDGKSLTFSYTLQHDGQSYTLDRKAALDVQYLGQGRYLLKTLSIRKKPDDDAPDNLPFISFLGVGFTGFMVTRQVNETMYSLRLDDGLPLYCTLAE